MDLMIEKKRYECPQGHVLFLTSPCTVNASADGIPLASGDICQVCYIEWLREQFPIREVVRDTKGAGE